VLPTSGDDGHHRRSQWDPTVMKHHRRFVSNRW
jgi:hypothetical protein